MQVARVLEDQKGSTVHISAIIKSSDWLPVGFGIDFKILLLVFKHCMALHQTASERCSYFMDMRPFRSSNSSLLAVSLRETKTFGAMTI